MEYEFAERGQKFVRLETIDADLGRVDPWELFYSAWHEYLLGGPEPSFSGRNNLKVFALLSAAIESIETGQAADVATAERYSRAYIHSGEWSSL